MNDLLGAPPAPTFNEPLDMLLACHSRIQAQCATLKKLLVHLPAHGNDTQAQQAAQAILRYFDTAGIHHHHDEEKDLFPLLLASAANEASALITRILDEHQVMETAWQRLRPYLSDLSSGQSAALDPATAEHFIDVYDRHIALENSQLLPLAKRILSAGQLQALGRHMATRRMN